MPFCSLSLHQITGHPGTDVFVSTPATEVFDFNLTNSKSGRPLYFKPERLVELGDPRDSRHSWKIFWELMATFLNPLQKPYATEDSSKVN